MYVLFFSLITSSMITKLVECPQGNGSQYQKCHMRSLPGLAYQTRCLSYQGNNRHGHSLVYHSEKCTLMNYIYILIILYIYITGKSGPERISRSRSLTGLEWLQLLEEQYPDGDAVNSDSIRKSYHRNVDKFEQLTSPRVSAELRRSHSLT